MLGRELDPRTSRLRFEELDHKPDGYETRNGRQDKGFNTGENRFVRCMGGDFVPKVREVDNCGE